MSDGNLLFGGIRSDCGMVDVDGKQSGNRERSGNRPGQGPGRPPWFADGGVQRLRRLFHFGQGQRNNRAAVRAHGEMVEHLLAFVRGQRLFDEGADLVRVGMALELERLAHIGPVAAVDAL
jgi:hypothetical protein